MKKILLIFPVIAVFVTISARGQGTAFTYQGRLNDGSSPANGAYDFRFRLASDPLANNYIGSAFFTNGLHVTAGLFTITLDFGANIFTGSNVWLEVDVRTNGGSSYTVLDPLQPLTPSPYAIFAGTAGTVTNGGITSAQLASGSVGNAQIQANAITAGQITSGQVVKSLNSLKDNVTLTAGANISINPSGNNLQISQTNPGWSLTGNSGTTAGANFVGTTDNQPFQLHVSAARALRIEPNTNGAPNIIAGSQFNSVSNGVVGATIAGGGSSNVSGAIVSNTVTMNYGAIGGGYANTLNGYAGVIAGGYLNANNGFVAFMGAGDGNIVVGNGGGDGAVLVGGYGNTNGGEAAAIVGGQSNFIGTPADHAFIGGGGNNSIIGSATLPVYCSLVGGLYNTIGTNVAYGSIGGGQSNTVSGSQGTVAGGLKNTAGTNFATVGGGRLNQATGVGATVAGGGTDGSFNAGNAARGDASTISGGVNNQANGNYSAAGGGANNIASGNYTTVSGGLNNEAFSTAAAVAGGSGNTAFGAYSFVGGGVNNGAGGFYSVVCGGTNNSAAGQYSFAAGQSAGANFDGDFVWADSQTGSFAATGNDQFWVRARGGANFTVSGSSGLNPAAFLINSTSGNGVAFYAVETSSDACVVANNAGTGSIIKGFNGGGSPVFEVVHDGTVYSKGVALTSDRNAKQNFSPINSAQILEKVASLPITQWTYKADDAKHIGPVAQDFHEKFGLNGADDKHISVVDEGGVALAAIQGLNQKLETELTQKELEIRDLRRALTDLQATVSRLRK